MPLRKATAKVTATCSCHNGTDSRDLLPLRKRSRRTIQLRKATAKVTATCGCHNGTDSRNLLPLRKD